MSKRVDEFRIIDKTENIFDLEGEYVIPLYQRAFAWEEKQLEQLVEDINDIRDKSNYYIGSLVVSRFLIFTPKLSRKNTESYPYVCVPR